MMSGQSESQKSSPHDAEGSLLIVADMVHYLLSLAKLYEEDKVGNAGFSEGLQSVAHALRPYSDYQVQELADAIKKDVALDRPKSASAKAKSELPSGLESLGQEDLERILNDEGYTKQQIVEIGVRRFGISRWKLVRSRKKDARDSVRAALEHEKSLEAIAKEARRGGKARSA